MQLAKHEDPLEDLLSHALIEHSNTVRGHKAMRSQKDLDANYRACFTRPDNWILKRQVRLLHVEGNVRTLIGLFDELVHTYVPKCRRLVAAATVQETIPQALEEVQGSHWLPSQLWEFKRQPAERKLQLPLNLVLDMGQHLTAQAVLCEASLIAGGLQRLCLLEDTMFEGTTPRTILQLPAGLDILEGVLGGCKVLIWKEINEEVARA